MYALFFLICLTGEPECYQPFSDAGEYYTYPDKQNCETDKQQHGLSDLFQCLPVTVIHAGDSYGRK